jgi:hypothetical protein
MKTQGTRYRVIPAIGISLTSGVGTFLSVFFGMVFYADHKFPLHNSMAGIEAFVIGSVAGLSVFALRFASA